MAEAGTRGKGSAVIELQLVGYSAETGCLIFCDETGRRRYRVPVDARLRATLAQTAEAPSSRSRHDGEPVPAAVPRSREQAPPAPPSSPSSSPADAGAGRRSGQPPSVPVERAAHVPPPADRDRGRPPARKPSRNRSTAPEPGPASKPPESVRPEQPSEDHADLPRIPPPVAASAVEVPVPSHPASREPVAPQPVRGSALSPREIQSLLRAGRDPGAVAKLARTDEAWVRRWLGPIEAERNRVLSRVWRSRTVKSRLGPSRDPVGEAVSANLAAKGLPTPGEDVAWLAARADGDDFWTVSVRYRSRGRQQRAVWRYHPADDRLEPRNDLAVELAWTRPVAPEPPVTAGSREPRAKPSPKSKPARGQGAKDPAQPRGGKKRAAATKATEGPKRKAAPPADAPEPVRGRSRRR